MMTTKNEINYIKAGKKQIALAKKFADKINTDTSINDIGHDIEKCSDANLLYLDMNLDRIFEFILGENFKDMLEQTVSDSAEETDDFRKYLASIKDYDVYNWETCRYFIVNLSKGIQKYPKPLSVEEIKEQVKNIMNKMQDGKTLVRPISFINH